MINAAQTCIVVSKGIGSGWGLLISVPASLSRKDLIASLLRVISLQIKSTTAHNEPETYDATVKPGQN